MNPHISRLCFSLTKYTPQKSESHTLLRLKIFLFHFKNVYFLFRVLEHQIQELVQKLLDGQGLPLIKSPSLRRMAGYEKTRVMVLRQLETDLGVRRPGELKMATDPQILPVVL